MEGFDEFSVAVRSVTFRLRGELVTLHHGARLRLARGDPAAADLRGPLLAGKLRRVARDSALLFDDLRGQ